VVYSTLVALAKEGQFETKKLPQALKDLGIDPEKVDPAFA
jgi:pyruvate dehydrogenase E1 component